MSLALQYYAGHVGSGDRVKDNNRGNGKLFILSFLNLISSYSTRLCASSGSKPYGALRIRIEIVLPLAPKMG